MNQAREGRQQSKETVTFPTEALRLGTRCSASRTAPPKPTPRAHHRWKPRQASPTGRIRVPSHSPSDIVSSHSKLWWALVQKCTCRKIHLYGESKKSTHGHQIHLPSRTHHLVFDKISIPTATKSNPDHGLEPLPARSPPNRLTSPAPTAHPPIGDDDVGCTHRPKYQNLRLDELYRMV